MKESQKNWSVPDLYELYNNKMKEIRTTRKLPPNHRDKVISTLYEPIQNRDTWIPYGEVKKYTFSKTTKIVKSFNKQFPTSSEEMEDDRAKK